MKTLCLSLLLLMGLGLAGCGSSKKDDGSAGAVPEDKTPVVAQVALNALKKGDIAGTSGDLRTVATALQSYARDTGSYPEVEDYADLAELLTPQYLMQLPTEDYWRQPYRYQGGGQKAELRSAGPDGDFDTEDDIVVKL